MAAPPHGDLGFHAHGEGFYPVHQAAAGVNGVLGVLLTLSCSLVHGYSAMGSARGTGGHGGHEHDFFYTNPCLRGQGASSCWAAPRSAANALTLYC